MPIGFTQYCRSYLTEPDKFLKSIDSPLLFWAAAGTLKAEQVWTSTMPGIKALAPRAGDPLLFELKKSEGKSNVFQMGVTVGRIDSNDIAVDDVSISRFHAYFQKDKNGDWNLIDAESKNGTWVGPLKLAPNARAKLVDETPIRFGNVDMVFLMLDGLLKRIKGQMG
jgi:hypothetical protein